jgi:hypothetical protein
MKKSTCKKKLQLKTFISQSQAFGNLAPLVSDVVMHARKTGKKRAVLLLFGR